jgi:hypothetical protein
VSDPIQLDRDGDVIDITPKKPRRRRWKWLILVAFVVLLFIASRAVSIYISAAWFGSLGYSSIFWFIFRTTIQLFLIFFVVTTAVLRGAFWLIERAFSSFSFGQRTVFINQQPVNFSPARLLRPLAWIVSVAAGFIFGLGMRESWRSFAPFSSDPQNRSTLGSRSALLFTLPVYDAISRGRSLTFIMLAAAPLCGLAMTQQGLSSSGDSAKARRTGVAAVSTTAAWLVVLVWRFVIGYPYLWEDHQLFPVSLRRGEPSAARVWVAGQCRRGIDRSHQRFALRKAPTSLGRSQFPSPSIGHCDHPPTSPAYVKPNELPRVALHLPQYWPTRTAYGMDHIE